MYKAADRKFNHICVKNKFQMEDQIKIFGGIAKMERAKLHFVIKIFTYIKFEVKFSSKLSQVFYCLV